VLIACGALCGCGDQVIVGEHGDLGADAAVEASDLSMDDLARPRDLAPRPDLQKPTLASKVRANPAMVVGAIVDVTAPTATDVVIDYGMTSTYGQTTPHWPVAADGTASVPVFGLPPSTTMHFRVRTFGPSPLTGPELTLATGPLPASFPTWTVSYDDNTTDGFMMLSFIGPGFSWGYAIIIDRQGQLWWYYAPTDAPAIVDFQQQSNGRRTIYKVLPIPQCDEVDSFGTVVRSWYDPFAPYGADAHDFVIMPNDDALMIGRGHNVYDTTSVIDGGTTSQPFIDTVVDEVTPDGGSVFHWSSYGQVGPEETTPDIDLRVPNADVQHVNALAVTNDGNVLISMRHTDTVYKIDRASGTIAWRLGGKKSDFTFVNDPFNGFSHQHFARQLANGDVLLLDNGNLHSPPVSRAAQYRLDEVKKTATLVWQVRSQPDQFTVCCGSAEREANGDTIVDWAATSTGAVIDEYDPFSTMHWELRSPTLIYRALRIDSL
jgi:hypothetical protein